DATAAGVSLDDFLAVDDDGPFSLHDPAALTRVLEDAGWTDVTVEQHTLGLPVGGGLPPGDAAEVALDVGPAPVLLTGMTDDLRHEAARAIADAFAAHVNDDGYVVLSGCVNVVTATR